MALAMAGFSLNDGVMKVVLAEVPLFPAVFLRGLLACTLLYLLARRAGALRVRVAGKDRRLIATRTGAEVLATVTFLTALANMPISSASAIIQVSPLAITLAAALFLGEPVGWRRSAALVVGFLGVLLVVQPGAEGFNIYALSVLVTVGCVVVRDLATRRLSPDVPSLLVSLVTGIAILTLGGIGSLSAPWPDIRPGLLPFLALASVFMIGAYLFVVQSMRVGEVSFVSPFRYSAMIWALAIGGLFFGERPNALMLTGAALIIGSGLYTFWREQRLARQ